MVPWRGQPSHPYTLSTTCSSNSICLSLPSLHKQLLSPSPQGSSNPLSPFPSLGRLLPSLATKNYSLPPPEIAASSHLLPLSHPAEPGGQRTGMGGGVWLLIQPSHSLRCPGKRFNRGTGLDSLSANWAMLL